MKSVIFDLDNTLYPEIEYVKSGFRYVSSYLNSKYDLDEEEIFSQLMSIFEKMVEERYLIYYLKD
jgi:putative hydrolase of the HAD superfamily